MDRRQYLIRTGGAVGIATMGAGCLDTLTGSDSDEPADRTGERELERAFGEFNDAAIALQIEEDNVDDPEAIEFDATELEGMIADGRDHLETATDELGGHESEIETAETYAAILEALVEVTDIVLEVTLEAETEMALDSVGDDSGVEEAAATVEEQATALETADTRYEAARANLDALEDERFRELVGIEKSVLEDGVEMLAHIVTPLVTLFDGLEPMFDGYEDLLAGEEHIDNGEYEHAETALGDAKSAFETATTMLDTEVDSDTPTELADYIETAHCQSGHLADAADAYYDAAVAMDTGDYVTADQRRRDGDDAVDAAENCTV